MAKLDALLLSGGHDVSPLNYGEEPLQGLGDVFPERDQFDFALLKAAEEKTNSYLLYLSRYSNFKCISWWFSIPRFEV